MREFMGVHDSSEKILDGLNFISPLRPSVVFWPSKNNNLSIGASVIGYLAWPRPVEGKALSQEQLEQAVELLRDKPVSGIWLCGLLPSRNLKNWRVVNRGLLLIPEEQSR